MLGINKYELMDYIGKTYIADVKENKGVYQAAITADRAEAQKASVTGTPSFIIGTQLIQGARPYPTFQEAINLFLK